MSKTTVKRKTVVKGVAKKPARKTKTIPKFVPNAQNNISTKVMANLGGQRVEVTPWKSSEHAREMKDSPPTYQEARYRAWVRKHSNRDGRPSLWYEDCSDDMIFIGDLEEVMLTLQELAKQCGVATSTTE